MTSLRSGVLIIASVATALAHPVGAGAQDEVSASYRSPASIVAMMLRISLS